MSNSSDFRILNAVLVAAAVVTTIVLVLSLSLPGSTEIMLDKVLEHDGLVGGILAFIGALIAGYWAFKAQSENTHNLIRVENLRRNNEIASDIRDQLGHARQLMFLVKSALSNYVMRKEDRHPFPAERIELVNRMTKLERPKIEAILPDLVEYELNAAVNVLFGAANMLTELFSQEHLLASWRDLGQPAEPFLAFDLDHAKELIAAAEIKLRVIEKFYAAIRHHDKTQLPSVQMPKEEIEQIARLYGWSGDELLARLQARQKEAADDMKKEDGSSWENIIRSEYIR